MSLCGLLGVSKQAYYKYDDHLMERLARESFVVEYIKEVRRSDPGIGGEKLWMMYRKRFGREHSVGYNSFYDIIEKYDLKVRKRRRRARTTDSRHDLPLYQDKVRSLIPSRPCQVWVSDITYILLQLCDGDEVRFCYLSLVTDYYTKQIVGWSVGDTLETRYPLEALRMALKSLGGTVPEGLIHHSDRGVQYASYEYTGLLKSAGITISMTESGDPKDNAVAERVNNTMKNELLRDMRFTSTDEVRKAVGAAVRFYNEERPHLSLDGMTPAEAAQCTGEIRKRWHSFREKALRDMVA